MSQPTGQPPQWQGQPPYPPPGQRPPQYRNDYRRPKPQKDLPVWVYAIFVFAIILAIGLAVIVVLAPAGNSNSVSTVVVVTAQPASATSVVASQPNGFKGLGQDKGSWNGEHGQPDTGPLSSLYENKKFEVMFFDDKVWNLNRRYGRSPVSLDVAKAEAKTFMPQDAQFIRSYKSNVDSIIDLYSSESLRVQFSSSKVDPWVGAEPGQFIALYPAQTGQVTSYSVALGNK